MEIKTTLGSVTLPSHPSDVITVNDRKFQLQWVEVKTQKPCGWVSAFGLGSHVWVRTCGGYWHHGAVIESFYVLDTTDDAFITVNCMEFGHIIVKDPRNIKSNHYECFPCGTKVLYQGTPGVVSMASSDGLTIQHGAHFNVLAASHMNRVFLDLTNSDLDVHP